MRVALITESARSGGVTNVVFDLAVGLREGGHEVMVASSGGPELHKLSAAGARHFLAPLEDRGIRGIIRSRRKLAGAFKEFKPDIVHTQNRYLSLLSTSTGRIPDVTTHHLDRFMTPYWFDHGLLRRLISVWGRRVITLDETARQMVVKEFNLPPERVIVVPNGVDAKKYQLPTREERDGARRRFGLSDADRVAVYVGQFESWKRPDLCVKSLAYAVEHGADSARLLMVGDGKLLPPVKALSRQLSVEDRCVFTGWSDPLAAYHAGDFLVLPSEAEGWSLACVEAMLCGLPVLRTRRGGWREQIIEGKTGWSVEVGQDEELFKKFTRALASRDIMRECGLSAREHALKNFTLDVFVGNMLAVYEKILGEKRGKTGKSPA